ncbi:TPA: HAMP domain-containing protein [Candidatus Poribacteria bacterium]|nr:HAMP domain-containing protein [Candidatus Poribacteria bacterium]HEX29638.1 HAMP domain-containing protein [Candidatus Poribacteria bacterium]
MNILRSVRSRLTAIYLLSVAVIAIPGVYLIYSRSLKVMEGELGKYAFNTAISAARNVKYGVLLGDKESLRSEVIQVMGNPDVVYVLVSDAGGRVLIQRYRGGWDSYPLPPMETAPGDLSTKEQVLRDKKGMKFIDIFTPVVASKAQDPDLYVQKALYGFTEKGELPGETRLEKIGGVRLGVTFANAYARVKKTLFSSIAIFLVITAFGSILSLSLLSRYLANPLRRMADTAYWIAMGNLKKRVKVKGSHEISSLAESLNYMVDQLQSTIAQLEKVNDRLRREMDEKDDFLRAVSHDLNAPLRNIAGMASMLMRRYSDSLDEKGKDRLSRIMRNVEKEQELIAELLELSRIKTRRQPFSMVDLNEVVEQVIDELSYDIEAKGGTVLIKDKLPTIYCERSRFKQLFQNLIDNALKYSKEDEPPRIEIGFQERDEDYLFYVKDNGIGIRDEDKERIFHVFRRVQSPQISKVEGKGVGLAAVKRIIEVYGGDIWVESKYGRGSTFFFSLPKNAGGMGNGRKR